MLEVGVLSSPVRCRMGPKEVLLIIIVLLWFVGRP
jgi:hypothetical protein